MSNLKKIALLLAVFASVAIIAFGILYNISSEETQLTPKGPTQVTDYRELPFTETSATMIVDGLDAPWAFEALPNGDMLITERFGNLRIVENGTLNPNLITGVPEVFSAGQGGLLDVTIHPNFEENNFVYLSYAHGNQESNRLRVFRAQLNQFTLENGEVIFEVAQSKSGTSHYGSRFQWLPDGTLTFSVGDGGNPPIQHNGQLIREQAQFLNSHLGKIIRINDDGSIPEDNPFVGRPDALHEIYSYGHRNVQGLTFDTTRQRLIVSEHGSKGGDEVNLVEPGKNYGWPLATYSTEYDFAGTPISSKQQLPDMQDPLAVWTPSIAPSSIAYHQGDLFLAAMLLREDNSIKAYASNPAGGILRLKTDENGEIGSQELISIGDYRIRSLKQGSGDFLYVLSDATSPQNRPGKNAGTLWRVEL